MISKICFRYLLCFVLFVFLISSASAALIFSDNFESGSLSGWSLSNLAGANNWSASTTNPFQGTWHAQSQPQSTSEPASVLERIISTSGYQNIQFSYQRRLIGLDAADEFQMEWNDGGSWNILEQTGGSSANDASYLSRSFSLSSNANNNANFKIKFECTAGAVSEYCRVDNVSISGDIISDTSSPNVTIIFPLNKTYGNANIPILFNVSLNEAAGNVLFSLNNGLKNMTTEALGNNYYTNTTNDSISDGAYVFSAYANDTAGNKNYTENITFSIDRSAPSLINILSPNAEGKNYTTAISINNPVIFNITVNENVSATYSLDWGRNNISMNANTTDTEFWATNTSMANGNYTVNFFVNDSYNNRNLTLNRTFVVNVPVADSLSPIVSIIDPVLNKIFNLIPIIFNISTNEASTAYYSLNGGKNNISMSANSSDNGFSALNNSIADGNYIVSYYVNDSANNRNNTANRTFVVDTLAPNLKIISPLEGQILNSLPILFNISTNENATAVYSLDGGRNNLTMNANSSDNGFGGSNLSITDGSYIVNFYINDSANNKNNSANVTFSIDTILPAISLTSPLNQIYNSNVSTLNYSFQENNPDSCWYTINGGATNSSIVSCGTNFTNVDSFEGSNLWSVYINDSAGNLNSASVSFSVVIPAVVNCEAGGAYQKDALVLVQGNVTNSSGVLASQEVNVSVYNSNNFLNGSSILTTSSDGSFETIFSNLSTGSYELNATTIYKGFESNCRDSIQIGSPASFILDKTATIYNTTNTTVFYNITLRLINTGGADAINSNITDSDSSSSLYILGDVPANSSVIVSYLNNFTRVDVTSYYLLSSAIGQGIDSYSNLLISASSNVINISVPATSVGKQIVITKNVAYLSENSTSVSYNVSSTLYNSGDEDLIDLSYVDSDISGAASLVNLTKGNSYMFDNLVVLNKAASNTQYQFALGTASISSLSFYSNRPSVNIPGYGGPADVLVYAPSSVNAGSSFNSVISVSNVNPDIGQDFIIDYWVTNDLESVNYSSGQQTVYVSALGTVNTSVGLSAPSFSGSYRLRALVNWVGGTASGFDSFDVVGSSEDSGGSGGGSTGGGGSGGGGGQVVVRPVQRENKTETGRISEEGIVCESPYIRHGRECCLDVNSNLICDSDERENKTGGTPDFFTGLFIRTPDVVYKIDFIQISLALLLFLIVLVLVGLVTKMLRKTRVRDISRLSNVIGLKVYTSEGIELGVVREIVVSGHKVDSLFIKLLKKYRRNIKGIIVSYKQVESIKDVVIVEHRVLERFEENNSKI